MKKFLSASLVIFFLMGLSGLFAQDRGAITGVVKSSDGTPVAGALVKI